MKNLLLYRMTIFNALAVSAVVYMFLTGYAFPVFDSDSTRLAYAIAIIFTISQFWVARYAVTVNAITSRIAENDGTTFDEFDSKQIDWLSNLSDALVGIGLLGTVVGFSIALGAINDADLMNATGTQKSIGTLMSGMQTAINTTIVGAIGYLWADTNHRMLKTAIDRNAKARLKLVVTQRLKRTA